MAENENVTIRIRVRADTDAIDRVQRRLAALCAQADRCDETFKNLGRSLDDTGKEADRSGKSFDRNSKTMRNMGNAAGRLSGILKRGLTLALKGALLETAALAAALSSVNLLLKVGPALSRAYQASITGIGVAAANAAAGVGALVAIFTQAMRQFAAAQASAGYGGNFGATSQALRMMQGDAELAVFGLQSLTTAFAAASRNARVTGQTISSLRGLADFAIATGDMEKGLTAAAQLVSLLQSGKGAGSESVLDAVRELGPEFEKAFTAATKAAKGSNQEILRMIASGQLAQTAGIAGVADNVRGTLMGQLKSFGTELQVMFADLGNAFIEPVQRAFAEISRIFRRTMVSVSGSMAIFSEGPFLSGIIKVTDYLGRLTEKLINEYLPRTEEVIRKISVWWDNFRRGWDELTDDFTNFLRRFSEASSILNEFFGRIFRPLFDQIGENFGAFARLVVDNKEDFLEFGDALGSLIKSIFELFGEIRESFFMALPAITYLVNAIEMLVDGFRSLLDVLQALGGFGGLAGLVGLAGLGGVAGGGRAGAGRMARARGGIGAAIRANPMAAVLGTAAVGASSFIPGVGGDLAGQMLLGGLVGRKIPGLGTRAFDALKGKSALSRLGMRAVLPFGAAGAGAAAAGGAVGAAGLYATSQAINAMESRYGSTQANIGVGAAGGALSGAAAGAIFGGPAGALVGAGIGALIGVGMGWWKSRKAKEQARETGESFGNDYATALVEGLRTGDIRGVEQQIAEYSKNLAEVGKNFSRNQEFEEAADKSYRERMKQIAPVVAQFNRNLSDLEQITGKTEEEIIAAARAADVDLGSNLLSLQEILSETGLAVGRFGDDFNATMSQVLGNFTSNLESAFAVLEAPAILDEASAGLRGLLQSGEATDRDISNFMSTLAQQAQIMFQDPVEAMRYLYETIGTADMPGYQFTTEGGVLGGMQGQFFQGREELFASAYSGMADEIRALIVQNIQSEMARAGVAPRGGMGSITSLVGGMGISQLLDLASTVGTEGFLSNALSTRVMGRTYGYAGGAEQDLSQILGQNIDLMVTQNQKNDTLVEGFGTAAEKMSKDMSSAVSLFGGHVSDFGSKIATIPSGSGDTSSPRSNILRSMNAHGRFDSMIAGKRSVTSGLRSHNLGSLSSDHRFGRAYDLTGQNLGAYKTAVESAGGFAEFHGGTNGRHLHVVPGSSAIGDTAVPYMGGTSSGTSVMTNDTYSIVVNAGPNADAKQIADEVFARIERKQRSVRERS